MIENETVCKIQKEIENIRNNSQLASPAVTLLAASKGQGEEAIRAAIACGVTVFGENRVQEAEEKWPQILKVYPKVELHLIGPLQTNKAKQALELFDVIETIDRAKLAEALASEIAKLPPKERRFMIQVNIGKEPQKSGVMPEEADELIAMTQKLGLNVTGLMCVPPVEHPPGPYFALLREIALRNGLSELSMGMSDDYLTGVRMGSSCVRLGRVLFGEDSRKA